MAVLDTVSKQLKEWESDGLNAPYIDPWLILNSRAVVLVKNGFQDTKKVECENEFPFWFEYSEDPGWGKLRPTGFGVVPDADADRFDYSQVLSDKSKNFEPAHVPRQILTKLQSGLGDSFKLLLEITEKGALAKVNSKVPLDTDEVNEWKKIVQLCRKLKANNPVTIFAFRPKEKE